MALEGDRMWQVPASDDDAGTIAKRAPRAPWLAVVWRRTVDIWRFLDAHGPLRKLFSTLARRIVLANLLGLIVLVGGMVWLSQQHAWLITAKYESLKVQGEIIASAIASSALVEREGRLAFDPERLPELDGVRVPFRDDGFAAMELSLRHERVIPVLRRLIHPTHNTRARIYDRNGKLIVDSSDLQDLQFPLPLDPSDVRTPEAPQADSGERVKVKNFWTRLSGLFDRSDLPIYREIGRNANGTSYPEVRQALRGAALPPMLLLTDDQEKIVSLAVPIQRRNAILGALLLSTRPGEIDEIIANERSAMAMLVLLALAASVLASLLLARTIAGPMRRLSEGAESVSRSIHAHSQLPDFGKRQDEVGQLSNAVHSMTRSLYRRIESSEKFAADVAHELKNPLTAAQVMAQSLHYARTPEQREQVVQQVLGELKRLNRLITDVANTSRLDAELALQKTTPVDIRGILRSVVETFRGTIEDDRQRVELDIQDAQGRPDAFIVNAHESNLGRVVTNLLDNALSFSPPGGTVSVRAAMQADEVEFSVSDEGPGVPPESIDKIFERFYSDRPQSDRTQGKNSGLGLSISREIVSAHGGHIWAENRVEDGQIVGACFKVRLPVAHVRAGGWRQRKDTT
ncbi:MAG: stimulus-sensing domain-containing protein [Hyphomicrobium sp.]|nr:stimulus-sensing domain-containing protein [Hyphomicrobium sp.]